MEKKHRDEFLKNPEYIFRETLKKTFEEMIDWGGLDENIESKIYCIYLMVGQFRAVVKELEKDL